MTSSAQSGFHRSFHRAQSEQHTKPWARAQKPQHTYRECWICLTFLIHETHSCALTHCGAGETRKHVSRDGWRRLETWGEDPGPASPRGTGLSISSSLNFNNFIIFFNDIYLCVCVYMYVYECVYSIMNTWRPKDYFCESFLSFYDVGGI